MRLLPKNGKRKSAASGNGHDEDGGLEAAIVELARSGALAKAGLLAVRRQMRKGIPVTFVRGNQIIRKSGKGREKVIGHVERVKYTLPAGVELIDNK